MRFITGGIMHETHSFPTVITTEADYGTRWGDEVLTYAGTNRSAGGVIDECRDRGIELVHTMQAKMVTSGPPSQATFERMVDELVSLIGQALPADGVVLTLHGAMVAEGYPAVTHPILVYTGSPAIPIQTPFPYNPSCRLPPG